MYESPITIAYNQMKTTIENDIYKAICNVGIDVDKEELWKALQYDRGQYEKGYDDGIKIFVMKLKEVMQKWYCDFSLWQNKKSAFDIIDNLVKEMVGDTE